MGTETVVSTQDALLEVTPIRWSEDVLKGNHRDKNLIKSKDIEK